MSVTVETSRTIYTGNGVTTVYPTGFVFLDNTEVTVKYNPASITLTLVEGVDYTLTGAGNPAGGVVTMLSTPSNLSTLTVERIVPYTQTVDLSTQGSYSPDTLEEMADELTFQTQQLDRRVTDLESVGPPVGALVAGDGLTLTGGTTLDVVAGTGIVVAANSVSADISAAAPVALTAAAGTAGAVGKVSDSGHRHQVSTAAPSVALTVGGAAAVGAAGTLLRSDAAFSAPTQAPGAVSNVVAAAGASGKFSDAAHVHSVSSAAAVELTDATNAAGVGAPLALADHTHAHGNRSGGALHAVATHAANGFMSAAQFDVVNEWAKATTQTTNAVAKTLMKWTPAVGTVIVVEAFIAANRSNHNEGGGWILTACFAVSDAGVLRQVGATVTTALAVEDVTGAPTVSLSAVGVEIVVAVTGVAAVTIDWACTVRAVLAP